MCKCKIGEGLSFADLDYSELCVNFFVRILLPVPTNY